MYIFFKNKKIEKICNNPKQAKLAYGQKCCNKLNQRLSEISACENFEILSKLPNNGFHSLKGDRKGQYALKIEDPMRLIVVPIIDDEKNYETNFPDIKELIIIEIVDYHG